MSSVAVHPFDRGVLADRIPGALVRDAALVLGGAGLTGVAAQMAFPLPGTPVPVTGQTFAVLLTGAALGSRRGAVSMLIYLLAGLAGVPWFTGADSGWGATGGYLLGFVVAAVLVGALAERGGDRTAWLTGGTMLLGTVVIYAFGVPVLMMATGWGIGAVLASGVVPFLLGDAVKVVLAAGLLPATWKLVRRLGHGG